MKTRLVNAWYWLVSSLWFVPCTTVAASVVLAYTTQQLPALAASNRLLVAVDAETARAILVAVATSMITVAGVVFSITMLVLSQTSSQFGPRLVRNFMRDRSNQVVLGVFVATFTYCLLSLAIASENADSLRMPTTIALLLATVDLLLLIYFIHRVSVSIQANNIVAKVATDLEKSIRRYFPDRAGEESSEDEESKPGDSDSLSEEGSELRAIRSGYLQAINWDRLRKLATKQDVTVSISLHPGDFVTKGQIVGEVRPGVPEPVAKRFRSALLVGSERNFEQDPEFALSQLIEIAARALSPGINDFNTAVVCVDWLGATLGLLARRGVPSKYRYDNEGTMRVIAATATFVGMADSVFGPLRQFSNTNLPVAIRLLEVIARVAPNVSRPEDRTALIRHATAIRDESTCDSVDDREVVEQRLRNALHELGVESERMQEILDGADSE